MSCDPKYPKPLQGSAPHSLVQTSYPLLSLWKSSLSLAELKILDICLARIDSHRPDHRWVRFQKRELESILGVSRIRMEELKKRLKNLCIVVSIEDPEAPRGFRAIALFEQMLCNQDENGLWQVGLQCSSAAMQYLFSNEKIGYIKSRLHAILHLRSRYSYVLLLYVENNGFRGQWEVPVDELRAILHCDEDSCYQEFRRFNDRVLKRAHQEIIEKTECRFSYETVRTGRRVTAIRFLCEAEDAMSESTKRLEAIQLLPSACVRNGQEPPPEEVGAWEKP